MMTLCVHTVFQQFSSSSYFHALSEVRRDQKWRFWLQSSSADWMLNETSLQVPALTSCSDSLWKAFTFSCRIQMYFLFCNFNACKHEKLRINKKCALYEHFPWLCDFSNLDQKKELFMRVFPMVNKFLMLKFPLLFYAALCCMCALINALLKTHPAAAFFKKSRL